MSFEGKLFWLVHNTAFHWLFQVLKDPVLIEIVAMKMKLDHGCKIEKKKRLFLLSDVSIYWSYIPFDISIIS